MTILYEGSIAVVGAFDNVQVYQWFAPPTVEALRAVTAAQLEHALAAGGKTAAITLVDPGVGVTLNEEVRKAGVEAFRTMQPHLYCSAFLVEDRGFFASLARSILFGLTSVARVGYPLKVFGELEPCVDWLDSTAQKAGRNPVQRTELSSFVRHFEARRA